MHAAIAFDAGLPCGQNARQVFSHPIRARVDRVADWLDRPVQALLPLPAAA